MLQIAAAKYDKDGRPRAILGHNLSLGALGVFILWFCWFGFNGASTVSMTGDDTLVSAGLIFVNTNMSAAVACCVTMIYTWLRYGKPDVGMTMNAALAGLEFVQPSYFVEERKTLFPTILYSNGMAFFIRFSTAPTLSFFFSVPE